MKVTRSRSRSLEGEGRWHAHTTTLIGISSPLSQLTLSHPSHSQLYNAGALPWPFSGPMAPIANQPGRQTATLDYLNPLIRPCRSRRHGLSLPHPRQADRAFVRLFPHLRIKLTPGRTMPTRSPFRSCLSSGDRVPASQACECLQTVQSRLTTGCRWSATWVSGGTELTPASAVVLRTHRHDVSLTSS